MLLLLDFDDTLFNTELFNKKIQEIFLSHGVQKDDLELNYQKAYARGYTFEKQLKILKNDFGYVLDQGLLTGEYKEIMKNAKKFLWKDTLPFLTYFSKQCVSMTLISSGNSSWQKAKIKNASIQDFFQKILIVPPKPEKKVKAVKNRCKTSPELAVFIDDKGPVIRLAIGLKKNCPRLVVIRMLRGRHKANADSLADYTVANLAQAKRIIKTLPR